MKQSLIIISIIALVALVILDNKTSNKVLGIVSVQSISNEKADDYNSETIVSAPVLSNASEEEIKKHITDSLIAGELPVWNAVEVPIEEFARLYTEAAKDIGVKDLQQKIANGKNIGQEIRLRAKEKGMDVKEMKRKADQPITKEPKVEGIIVTDE